MKTKLFFFFFLVFVVYVTSTYLPQVIDTAQDGLIVTTQVEDEVIAVPFHELTIPFLRMRTYKSELAELERIKSNASYTSYLTSYDSDGLSINGLLTQPVGEAPEGGWPAIVFIHGYIPPTQYRTQEKYVEYIDSLARSGFVVFKIDLRGHGSSEGEPGGAYFSSDYVIDTLNAYSALQNAEFVNKDKIGLWGHSMSGNVVLRSMVTLTEIPAAVIWAGAVYTYQDMREYGIDDNSYRTPSTDTQRQRRRQELFDTHGEFDLTNSFWSLVAPTNYLSDMNSAIQIHHAQNDDVVSIEYSNNLVELLEKAGTTYEYHTYPSGGHNISGSSYSSAMKRTIEFFKLHL